MDAKQCDPNNQYTCDDGTCIMMDQRCDGVTDCREDDHGGSDEHGCDILTIDEVSYRKADAPISSRGKKVNVTVNLHINKLDDFETIDMTYRIRFEITLRWTDPRLTFIHLRKDSERNVIDAKTRNRPWIPPLQFSNAANERIVAQRNWFVDKTGEPKISPLSVLDETYSYPGLENNLAFQAKYNMIFSCEYQLHCYPFDTQICTLEVSVYLPKYDS